MRSTEPPRQEPKNWSARQGAFLAAPEAALALRELAGERVIITLLAPEPEFVYRPMTVREPFAFRIVERYARPAALHARCHDRRQAAR